MSNALRRPAFTRETLLPSYAPVFSGAWGPSRLSTLLHTSRPETGP
jgi:hypothetical protein